MTDQWVIVLGRNYTSRLGMIRAAGLAGCKVAVIKTDKKKRTASRKGIIDGSSKSVKKYYCCKEPDDKGIISLLLKEYGNQNPKAILIPTDDYTASLIDLNTDILKEHFLFPNVKLQQGQAVRFMDKKVQKQLVREAGLNVAKGWTAVFDKGVYRIPDDVSFPCFIKPNVSMLGDKHFMQRCEDLESLKEALDQVAERLDCDVLIEEYIDIEKEYDIPGLALGEKILLPGIIEKGIIYLGVTGTGVISPWEDGSEIREKLSSFLSTLDFTGLIDVELYESHGKIYFNELNMRFGASGYALTRNGINLPKHLIRNMSGDATELHDSVKRASFASEKVCFQEYINGEITWKEFRRIISSADYSFIENNEDPLPGIAFKIQSEMVRCRKLVKRIGHRG